MSTVITILLSITAIFVGAVLMYGLVKMRENKQNKGE